MLKRTLLALAAATTLAGGAAAAETQVYYGFHVGITNAPPPPKMVYRETPDLALVPGTMIYVVERDPNDYDMFRVGSYWYLMTGGYWYRAQNYRGPFLAVDVRHVPRAIFSVPAKHWKHHPHGGPPGLAKKQGSRGHGHGRGQDKGKGKVAEGDD